jgi:hypothetical protein
MNVDVGIIQPVVQRQYEYNLMNEELFGLVGDYKIVPKGLVALMAKEQQSIRDVELLNAMNNPVDAQITGIEGRKALWEEVLTNMGKDVGLIFPKGQPIPAAPPQAALPAPPQASPENLDPAGLKVVGQETRMNSPEKPKGKVSTPGNAGTANGGK